MFGVYIRRKDRTKAFFRGMHIAGVWDGDLIWTDDEALAPGEAPPWYSGE